MKKCNIISLIQISFLHGIAKYAVFIHTSNDGAIFFYAVGVIGQHPLTICCPSPVRLFSNKDSLINMESSKLFLSGRFNSSAHIIALFSAFFSKCWQMAFLHLTNHLKFNSCHLKCTSKLPVRYWLTKYQSHLYSSFFEAESSMLL